MQKQQSSTMSEQSNDSLPGDPTLVTSAKDLEQLINKATSNFKYSVEDFFRTPEKTRYQLSPDGLYFSYMSPYKRRQNIFIQKIGEDKAVRVTNETKRDISSFFWANNNRILYIKDSGGDENFQLYAVDKDGANNKDLTPFEKVRIQLIDRLEDFEEEIIIGMNKNNPQLFEPYRINIVTGLYQQLAENTNPLEPIDTWMTDHNGKLRIASKIMGGTNTVLMYRDKEDEAFRNVITTDFRETIQPLFFEFDNSSIVYAASNLNRDKTVIIKFDMATGKETGDVLFGHEEVDVSELSFSKKRKVLTAIAYNTTKYQFHYLDPERATIAKRLEEELGDYERWVTSMNKAEDKFMVRTFSDRSLGAYYFYDLSKDELTKIADISPWIDETDMAEMQPIKYQSRDGLTINGYLTLPKGIASKSLPRNCQSSWRSLASR